MKSGSSILVFSLFVLGLFSVSFEASAAVSPIESHAVYVEGDVNYVSIEDSRTYPVELKTPFREGDQVVTGPDGKVEIEFDTGDVIIIDSDSNLTIKSLNRDDEGATSIVFDLLFGQVKSFVSKLADKSKFEFHTKAAISGVAGTEFVTKHEGERTDVYNTGEEGDVFAQGFDDDRTKVIVPPGFGTTVIATLAPLAPFILGPAILQGLGELVFHTGGGAAGGAGGAAGASTGISGTTMLLGGAALAGVAVAAGSSSSGGGSSSTETTTPTTTPTDPTAPPKDVTGVWDLYLRCAGRDTDVSKLELVINQTSGGAFSGSGSGTDYDGTSMNHNISGTYNSTTHRMEGSVTTTFQGNSCVRKDNFSTTLSSNDTGYISTNQVQVCGCDAEIRLVKVR